MVFKCQSLVALLFFLAQTVFAGEHPDFRLIVTGGLAGIHEGHKAFYESSLFHLGGLGDVVIKDTSRHVFEYHGTIFFSNIDITPSDIVACAQKGATGAYGKFDGLVGQAIFGMALAEDGFSPAVAEDSSVVRELGAILVSMRWEVRSLGNQKIFAIQTGSDSLSPQWPTQLDDIDALPAVFATVGKKKQKFAFFARSLGATARAFGIVDELLNKNKDIASYYVDLGNSLLSVDNGNEKMAKDVQKLLQARHPVLLAASTLDISALQYDPNILQGKNPYIIAARGGELPISRLVDLNGVYAQFSALGTLSPESQALLPKGTMALPISEAILKAQEEGQRRGADLVFGIADTSDAVGAAMASPVFDALFALVSGQKSALPAADDMDLQHNLENGLRSVAPLIRVSSSDVTEVSFWVDREGHIRRLRIERHPVVGDGVEAKDAEDFTEQLAPPDDIWLPGLPARSSVTEEETEWTRHDLENMLGQILIDASGAEMAIVEQIAVPSPMTAALTLPVAQALLERPGHQVTFEVSGKYLKRIIKLLEANQFERPVTMVGGSSREPTVSLRGIVNTEWYKMVTTEKVLLEIHRFLLHQSVIVENDVASTLVNDALGQRASLKILSSLKERDLSDSPALADWRDLVLGRPYIASIIHDRLLAGVSIATCQEWLKHAYGKALSSVILDISDFDLGIKFNASNQTIQRWRKTEDFKVPDSRLDIPQYLHVLLNARAMLKYNTRYLDTDLTGTTKFYQTDGTQAPSSDNTRADLQFRIPFERVLNLVPGSAYLSPVVRLSYETQIWPVSFLTSVPSSKWEEMGWLPRNKNAYGFVGVSMRPIKESDDDTLHVGAVSRLNVNNLSGSDPRQAWDFGFESAGQGKWSYGPFTFKLTGLVDLFFPIVEKPANNKLGIIMGLTGKIEFVVWQYLSVSVLADIYAGSLMVSRSDFGVSAIGGLAISYGQRFKWMT